jgi:hypothetical protein
MNDDKSNSISPSKYVFWLRLILTVKIFGFAAISQSAAVNKAIKIGLGTSMTIAVLFVTVNMLKKGYKFETEIKNSLSLWLYVFYLFLGTMSIFWANDYFFAIIQVFRDFDLLVFSFLFLRVMQTINGHHPDQDVQIQSMLSYAITFNTLYFLIGYFIDPDTFMRLTHGGDVARLGGYIMNPNELGMLSSLGISVLILDFTNTKNKWLYTLFLVINLYVIFLTGSRSSSIGFMIVCGLLILRSNNMKLKALMIAGFMLIAPIAINEVILDEEKGGLDEVMSMTGRLPFWKALLTEALPKEPLLGYGFQNIYYTKFFQGKNTYPASMTHNTFVQVVMNLGLVGFTIVIAQMAMVIRGVRRDYNKEKSFYFWCMFMPMFINSLTEFGIWGETNYGILFYQLLFLWFVVKVKPNHSFTKNDSVKQLKNQHQ